MQPLCGFVHFLCMENNLKITYWMFRRLRSAKTSVANNFCLGGVQFAGPVSDVGQDEQH